MSRTYKLVFLGDASVGKTTLINQYINHTADPHYNPTIGIDFVSFSYKLSNSIVKLQLWDTAGQERFNSLIPNYTRDCFAAVIVFDATRHETYEHIDKLISNLVYVNDPKKKTKIIVVCNKKDMESQYFAVNVDELGRDKAMAYNGKFAMTNAMQHEDIREFVDVLLELIVEDVNCSANVIELGKGRETVKLTAQPKSKCCF